MIDTNMIDHINEAMHLATEKLQADCKGWQDLAERLNTIGAKIEYFQD